MANILVDQYEVVEEGLPSRTAILDDPFLPVMTNGKTYLLPTPIWDKGEIKKRSPSGDNLLKLLLQTQRILIRSITDGHSRIICYYR